MNTDEKIKEIHDSYAFGILVETGCGLPVSNALLEVAGASGTVFYSECPYSKEYQSQKFKNQGSRAVSMETVRSFLSYHFTEGMRLSAYSSDSTPVNFVYASSFQLGNYNDKSTHGWIGIWTESLGSIYFHISIHESLSRKEYIEKISQIGTDLLYHLTITDRDKIRTIPSNCCIDIVLGYDGNQMHEHEMLVSLRDEESDNFLCITDGKFVRLEELLRDKENIVLFKGSFNPPHRSHVHIAEISKEKYGTDPVFVISSSVYQKGWIDPTELSMRAEMLNDLGYSVIITKDGYFNNNTEYIRQKFKQPIIYVVGTDTLNRILESSYKILNPDDEIVLPKPSHSGGELTILKSMADIIRKLEIEKFESDFENVTFFVVNRPSNELAKDASYVKNYYTFVEEHPDFHHFSSTKIRDMKSNGDIDGIRKLVPEKIADKYINLKNG